MRTEDFKYDLPQGWSIATIKDLVSGNDSFFKDGDWIESKDQNPSGEVRLIQLADIGDGEFKDRSNRYMTLTQAKELNCTFLEKGDILVARMPEPLGRACIFPIEGKDKFVTVVDVAIIRTGNDGVDNRLLTTFLNTPQFREKIKALQSGSTRKRISRNNLGSIKFPLPPLHEQIRIVSTVDELLSELENSSRHLELSQRQLGVYEQALLSHAFEGKISEKWARHHEFRSAEKFHQEILIEKEKRFNEILSLWKTEVEIWEKSKKGTKPRKPRKNKVVRQDLQISSSMKIPNHWKWIHISDFEELIGSGSTPKGGKSAYFNKGVKFIRSQNVLYNDLQLKDVAHIDQRTHEMMQRSQLHEKDVLINITGASIGRTAYVPENFGEANVNQHVCIIRVSTELVNYKYLTLYLNSPIAQSIIKRINSGATREALTFEQIRNFPFPLAPKAEQELIVEQLESKFSIIKNLEKSVQESLAQTEALRQSILKKAFEGKLVEQNSNDEPASELLERIKIEKKEYLDNQKILKQKQPKRTKRMSKTRNIKEVLQSSNEPILAKDVWQQSEHKDDIEKFYSELKKIKDSVKQVKEGTQSLLSLRS